MSEPTPFGGIAPRSAGVILADPPWRFATYSAKGEGKSPQSQYRCMTIGQLAALPVELIAARDCALILWATAPLLPEALGLVADWGFQFKTAGTWAKQSSTGRRWAFGTGFILRSAAEFFLIGTIGKPRVSSRSIRNLIVAPTRDHSRKPDAQYAIAEALFAGPYVELFSRSTRAGWQSWGDDAGRWAA